MVDVVEYPRRKISFEVECGTCAHEPFAPKVKAAFTR